LNLNQVYQSLIEHKPKPKIEPEEDDVTNQRVRYKKCKPGFTKSLKTFENPGSQKSLKEL